jgi:predicted DNA-binding transcriptional regulator YafY
MDYYNYAKKLESLKYFVESKSAVNALTLALKLGVSKRTVIRMVIQLRSSGYNITYCKRSKKYLLEK